MATALTTEPQFRAVAEVTDVSAGLLAVIERAARDPSVDIDKMERLIAMQERVQSNRAQAAYTAALAELQAELPEVEKRGAIRDKSGGVQSTYAKWEDVNEAIRPVLAKHGFGLSFRVERAPDGVAVTGVLSHRDGHSERTTLSLPIDASGAKNNVQGYGSSVSYGKRYTASALLNLTSRDEGDDDGQAAGRGATITMAQVERLTETANLVGADLPAFCRYMKVGALADIAAADFDRALAALNAKKPGGK